MKTEVIVRFILKRIEPNEVTSNGDQVKGMEPVSKMSLKQSKIVLVKVYW